MVSAGVAADECETRASASRQPCRDLLFDRYILEEIVEHVSPQAAGDLIEGNAELANVFPREGGFTGGFPDDLARSGVPQLQAHAEHGDAGLQDTQAKEGKAPGHGLVERGEAGLKDIVGVNGLSDFLEPRPIKDAGSDLVGHHRGILFPQLSPVDAIQRFVNRQCCDQSRSLIQGTRQ